MATGWKRIAEAVLARSGVPGMSVAFGAPRAVVLAYHNVVPHGERPTGDRSLHIEQNAFGSHLDMLTRLGTVLPFHEVVRSADDGDARLRIAVTFDDAYRGAMTAGVEELAKRGLTATVFVAPGLLGADGFWWDQLSTGDQGLDPALREHALTALGGRQQEVIRWSVRQGLSALRLPSHAAPVTATELLALDDGLMSCGAHTMSHVNLNAIPAEEAEAEMSSCKEWLASNSATYIDWLAYPYGLWKPAVAGLAGRYFGGALRVDGGLCERRHRRTSPPHATPRENVSAGLSPDGLALRVVGVLNR